MNKHKETLSKKQRKSEQKAFRKESQQEPVAEWKWSGQYSADDYRTTFFLHGDHENWPAEHVLRYCALAIYLVRCLQLSGYFGSHQPNEGDLKYVAGLMLRYLNICHVNATAVSALNHAEKYQGAAIFPSFSLLNHSCVRNAFISTIGKTLILGARRNITKGNAIL